MKERNSNIELLRILSMMFIVIGHFTSQSEVQFEVFSFNNLILFLLSYGLRIACNVFLMIGVWFLVDADFKASRIIKIYGKLIFYTWPLTIFAVILFRDTCSLKTIVKGLAPFSMRGLWFASAYITLLLIAPFLNKIIQWKQSTLKYFTFLSLVFISAVCTLPDLQDGYVIDTVWFAVVYLLIGYIKKYGVRFPDKKLCLLLSGGGYCLLAMALFFSKIFGYCAPLTAIGSLCSQYLLDIKTVPNLAISLLLFMAFIQMKDKHSKVINRMASVTFSVYIFHQVPAFYPGLWSAVFKADRWVKHPYFWYPVMLFILIYSVVFVVDYFRKRLIEPLWVNNKPVIKFERWIESKYRDL